MKYLTPEQADQLVGIVDKSPVRYDYKTALVFLRHTGARVGEIKYVTPKSFITYPVLGVTIFTLKRKDHPLRTIPLTKKVYEELKERFRKLKKVDVDRSRLRKIMRKYGREIGIETELLHPHVLRHTRAIELLTRYDFNIAEVRMYLGHKRLDTTAVYVEVAPTDMARKLSRTEAL